MADYTLTVEHYTIPHNTLLELISFNLIGVLTSYNLGIIRGVVQFLKFHVIRCTVLSQDHRNNISHTNKTRQYRILNDINPKDVY